MKHLVQRPLPDESVCSALVRTARRAGLPIGAVTPALTGGRKWYPGFFQGGHLGVLAEAMRISPVELLCSHTYFPYATTFFDQPLLDRCTSNALSTGKIALGQSVVTQGVSERCPFRRFCAKCARADALQWGESYWHRSHNLPGVRICLEHQAPLVETQLPTTGTGQWHDVLPAEAVGQSLRAQDITEFDRELARASVARLFAHRIIANVGLGRTHYRHALIRKGLLSSDRQVNAAALSRWATGVIGPSPARLGFKPSDLSFAWMAQMVRPNTGVPVCPLKHLVFQTALSIGGDSPTPILDHIPSGPSGNGVDRLDLIYSRRLKGVMQVAIRTGERIRVRDALVAAGCWSAYRHARADFPETGAIVLELRRSDASARKIAT